MFHFTTFKLELFIMKRLSKVLYSLVILVVFTSLYSNVLAEQVAFSEAKILISNEIASPVRETCLRVLKEEIEIRTSIELEQIESWSSKNVKIALALSSTEKLFGKTVPKRSGADLPELKSEGFRVYLDTQNGSTILWIIGADSRGVLFGLGEFLRKAELKTNSISLSNPFDFASSPVYFKKD